MISTKWGGARHTLFGKMEPVEMNEPDEFPAELVKRCKIAAEDAINTANERDTNFELVAIAVLRASKYAELVATLEEARPFVAAYARTLDRSFDKIGPQDVCGRIDAAIAGEQPKEQGDSVEPLTIRVRNAALYDCAQIARRYGDIAHAIQLEIERLKMPKPPEPYAGLRPTTIKPDDRVSDPNWG